MLTYSQALLKLGNKENKKVANNTYLVKNTNGTIGVKLHGTQVVVILPGNTFSLYSGGYRTVTTKQRINAFSPARVYQERGRWFVTVSPENPHISDFYEGITVDEKGEIIT